MNSAVRAAFSSIYSYSPVKNFFKISPSFLPMSIEGILIPAPVPSSLMITLFTFSTVLSITTARLPPALSIFLTFVANVQLPLSTKKIGVKIPSGSPL